MVSAFAELKRPGVVISAGPRCLFPDTSLYQVCLCKGIKRARISLNGNPFKIAMFHSFSIQPESLCLPNFAEYD